MKGSAIIQINHGLGGKNFLGGISKMSCRHKPDITFKQFLIWRKNQEIKCKFCQKNIAPSKQSYIIICILFMVYLVCGIVYLILYTFDTTLVFILIIGGILFHIAKFCVYRFGKYKPL